MKTENRNKRIVFTMGGKGGVGKTGLMVALAEWFEAHEIQFTLLDLDTENKARGSLKHFFNGSVTKGNIHTPAGLDTFIDHLESGTSIILTSGSLREPRVPMTRSSEAWQLVPNRWKISSSGWKKRSGQHGCQLLRVPHWRWDLSWARGLRTQDKLRAKRQTQLRRNKRRRSRLLASTKRSTECSIE